MAYLSQKNDMNEENNIDIHERITRLEVKIEDIFNHHIQPINDKVDKLVDKQDRLQWLIITTLVTTLAGFLTKLVAK